MGFVCGPQRLAMGMARPMLSASAPMLIQSQPDDSTCGPTALHAVYHHFGDRVSLADVVSTLTRFDDGGTLGAWLGTHALGRGYDVRLHTWNLRIFDPTWFTGPIDLGERLARQSEQKPDWKLRRATQAYQSFLRLGGRRGLCAQQRRSSALRR